MKKLLLFGIFLYLSISVSFSQTQKGLKFWAISGGIGHSNQTDINSDRANKFVFYTTTRLYNSYSIYTDFGKFVKNNICHGLAIGLSQYNNEFKNSRDTLIQNSNTVESGKTLQVKYFIRRFIPVIPQLYAFGEVNTNFRYSLEQKTYNNKDREDKNRSVNLEVILGLRYATKKSLFIDATANLGSLTYGWGESDNSTSSGLFIYTGNQFSYFNIGIGKTF
jgi:hypothetical protein